MSQRTSAISICNVVKKYGDFTAVQQMSLEIEDGEFLPC